MESKESTESTESNESKDEDPVEEDPVEEVVTSKIQSVQSTPPYISSFINGNIEQLNKIYDEGLQMYGCGILGFQCSQENNKMDVQFMNEQHICETMQSDSWARLKTSIPSGKRLFMVMDQDINSVFLVYI
jgi:hypothetical protein